MKRAVVCVFTVILLLSMTSCAGYNSIMQKHLGNERNYCVVECTVCSYKEAGDRLYLYVNVEDKSAFDSSEENSENIRLEFVGDNADVLSEVLVNEKLRSGDRITVKCSTWIYMDSPFYYVAEIQSQDNVILSFDDGLKNIIQYMADNQSLI